MRNKTALAFTCVVGLAPVGTAQGQEFARVLRNGEQAILSVFGTRPVDLAAKKLVDEFGVAVNVEDPLYFYSDDVQFSHVAASGKRVMVPRAALLEMPLVLKEDGSVRDVVQAVETLRDAANIRLPFAYRMDNDRDVFTLIPTRTRDEQGRSVDLSPLLDRHVTIPPGTRTIVEHVKILTDSLQQQTGIRVSCCQAFVSGIPWGSTVVAFEARDERARSALLRLLRREPGRDRLIPIEHTGAFRLVKAEPGREHWYWLMRCQPRAAWCFINVAPIPEKP
jgi:hypothetical protein